MVLSIVSYCLTEALIINFKYYEPYNESISDTSDKKIALKLVLILFSKARVRNVRAVSKLFFV